MSELREKLAEEAHTQWCYHMRYFLSNLNVSHLERWSEDAVQSYSDLSGDEKDACRREADRVLELVQRPSESKWREAAILLREAIKEHRSKVLAGSITTVLRDVLDTTRWMEGHESGASAQEWISVEDRLPKVYELVWAVWDGDYALMRRMATGWEGHTHSTDEGVTHWLPLGLPEVPK